MKRLHLYPSVPIDGKDFSKVKSITVPNQNMTLRDILKRFIRKESLPVEMEGVYYEGLGDLEKLQTEDITVRKEMAADLRRNIARAKSAQKAAAEKAAKVKPVDAPASGVPPQGDVTGAPVAGGQAPPASPPVTK